MECRYTQVETAATGAERDFKCRTHELYSRLKIIIIIIIKKEKERKKKSELTDRRDMTRAPAELGYLFQ